MQVKGHDKESYYWGWDAPSTPVGDKTKSIPNPVQLEVGHSKRLAHEMMSRRWILREPTLCEVLTQITQTDALNK